MADDLDDVDALLEEPYLNKEKVRKVLGRKHYLLFLSKNKTKLLKILNTF